MVCFKKDHQWTRWTVFNDHQPWLKKQRSPMVRHFQDAQMETRSIKTNPDVRKKFPWERIGIGDIFSGKHICCRIGDNGGIGDISLWKHISRMLKWISQRQFISDASRGRKCYSLQQRLFTEHSATQVTQSHNSTKKQQ